MSNSSATGGESTDAAGTGPDDDTAGHSGAGPQGGGAGGQSGGAGGQSGGAGGQGGSAPSIGSKCTVAGDCPAGNCVDGVCCESACTGCKACSSALTGKNDGACAAVLSGQDPHNQCADETTTNQCGSDGMCDGAGACRKVSTSHVCTAASCSGSNFLATATCDGAGACKASTPEACGAYPCTVSGCAKTCSAQTDCSGTNYCKIPSGSTSGTCAAKNTNGTAASQPFECSSNIVADGVCCDQACTGCKACSGSPTTAGSVGQCLNVVAGSDTHNTCAASGKVCGLDGACDGAGACRSTPRESQACSDDPANLCVSGGTCKSGTCSGAAAVTCPTPTAQCQKASCVPATGCGTTTATNGTQCNDGVACTSNDVCINNGTCSGTQITCTNPGPCKTTVVCMAGACPAQTNGVTDTSCPASSGQICYAGGCVKCTADSHCASSTVTPSCNQTSHTCVCRIPDPLNLLKNPGFDGTFSPWIIDTGAYVLKADYEGCGQSKSLFVNGGTIQQCVGVKELTQYYMGTEFSDGSPSEHMNADFYTSGDCTTGAFPTDQNSLVVYVDYAQNGWQATTKHQLVNSPQGAKSALISMYSSLRGLDQMYFGTVDHF